jgi:hypothetical protein
MTINSKFNIGQVVTFKSNSTGINKTGTVEKISVNAWSEKKVFVSYFLKGIFKEFKEHELKPVYERQNSATSG